MTHSNSPATLIKAADNDLEILSRNSARWIYYAGRVASRMGLTIEEMEREVDEAMETENSAAATDEKS